MGGHTFGRLWYNTITLCCCGGTHQKCGDRCCLWGDQSPKWVSWWSRTRETARCAVRPTACREGGEEEEGEEGVKGGRREGRKEGGEEGRRTGDSNNAMIKTGHLRPKQEGPTHSVQPPDSLLPVDLSEEFGTTLSLWVWLHSATLHTYLVGCEWVCGCVIYVCGCGCVCVDVDVWMWRKSSDKLACVLSTLWYAVMITFQSAHNNICYWLHAWPPGEELSSNSSTSLLAVQAPPPLSWMSTRTQLYNRGS